MSGTQRLTLASMWAFEDIGVEEVTDQIKKLKDQSDSEYHYHKHDNVLEVNGNLEGSTSQIARVVSNFIDGQENKDLLDMPRINQLDVSALMPVDEDIVASDSDKNEEGGLLALSDSSDQDLIPNPAALVTRFWLSPTGGVGCFSDNRFREFLSQIAALTGTEACVVEGHGIRVIGKSVEDVQDALAKLTRIEKPLSSILNPVVANLNATPDNGRIHFRMQSYGSLNSTAPRRLLTDPDMSLTWELGQMFVTVPLPFDEEIHAFREPRNITNPPHITEEPGRTRLWNDFVFQGIGIGDEYLALSTVDELARASAPATASSDIPTHPYLTPEKAKQVDQWNRWVVEGTGAEKPVPMPDADMRIVPHPEQSALKAPAPMTKRPPGIKQRRLITSDETRPSSFRECAEPKLKNAVDQVAEAQGDVSKGRKKWKMTYNTESGIAGQHVTAAPMAEVQAPQAQVAPTIDQTVPENKPRLIQGFDTTKYGLNRSVPKAMKSDHRTYPHTRLGPEKKLNNRKELIDTLGPVTTDGPSVKPTISFYQPALVPSSLSCSRIAVSPTPAPEEVVGHSRGNGLDLAGLVFEASGTPLELSSTESMQEVTSLSNDRETSPSHDRTPSHSNERATSSGRTRDASLSGDLVAPLSNARATSHSSEMVLEQTNRLASLTMVYNESNEGESLIVEQAYKAAPTLRQAQGNLAHDKVTEIERSHGAAKHLDDEVVTRAFRRTMTQKAPNSSNKNKVTSKAEARAKKQKTLEDAWGILPRPAKKPSVDVSGSQHGSGPMKERIATSVSQEQEQQIQEDMNIDEDIKKLYEALKPTLEAAETFPGAITLEAQIGLVLIPSLPKSCCEQVITFSDWEKIFKPRTGLAAPTTKFINRLTTSGADIDHLVDLRTSKAQGKRRLFEQEYDEYNVSYEFHCRTKPGQPLVLVIDEQGGHTLRKPVSSLGGVNLHIPLQIWDASFSVNCVTDHGPEFASAAQHMVDHLWIPADKPLLRIFTRLPAGNTISIEKVYMKRWTRHKFIRSDVAPSNEITGDLYLQVLETQDLIVGTSAAEGTAVRARAVAPQEMIRRGRLWYEASLVSPAIESLLKSNVDLEVGERAEDWSSVDLFGRDASLITPDAPLSPVAMAIGTGGLGDLLRLTSLVVERADGVGYFNQRASVSTKASVHSGALQIVPVSKGLEFDDIESVKDLGSACPQREMFEGLEREFW